jgi:hypothetical protein
MSRLASWWVWPCGALAIFGAAWLVIGFVPQSLSSLGQQMIAVLCVVISLAPVLFIGAPSEGKLP